MNITCNCGGECVNSSSDVLRDVKFFYNPCNNCKNWKLKKFAPLTSQIELNQINASFGSCKCGKRHLDIVMAHILKVMIENGIKDKRSTLRNTCVPLITPGYPTNSAPYLPEKSLVILTDELDKNCAETIIEDVPEVKGVLKGDLKKTVGIKDSNSSPNVYKLLAGCDMRCDIVQTNYGPICIYKHQGEIHIEFSKPVSPKITILNHVLKRYTNPTVLDCTCGPGTLGITCLKAGAKRVVFNDLWYPAARTSALNLEVNGFPVNLSDKKEGLIASGENLDVYCADVKDLKNLLDEKFDICLVDTFPGVNTENFKTAVNKFCQEIVVI